MSSALAHHVAAAVTVFLSSHTLTGSVMVLNSSHALRIDSDSVKPLVLTRSITPSARFSTPESSLASESLASSVSRGICSVPSKERTVDDHSVNPDVRAGDGFAYAATHYSEERVCFYCLSGWVFLGSLDHDGEEVFDAVRCRRCTAKGLKTA